MASIAFLPGAPLLLRTSVPARSGRSRNATTKSEGAAIGDDHGDIARKDECHQSRRKEHGDRRSQEKRAASCKQ